MRNKDELKARTQADALRLIRLVEALPRNRTSEVVGTRLLRVATSVGANYRAACWGKSAADFIAKMGIVEEEADECLTFATSLHVFLPYSTCRMPKSAFRSRR
ncbi:hypothetical protein NKDENANG_00738 [Candidatus Entotheonellaceae bacterium PAL068K]